MIYINQTAVFFRSFSKTAFQVWYEAHDALLTNKYPDCDDKNRKVLAAKDFRLLSQEEKQVSSKVYVVCFSLF